MLYCTEGTLNTWTALQRTTTLTLVDRKVISYAPDKLRALVAYDTSSSSIFVGFRGSDNGNNWIVNFKLLKKKIATEFPAVNGKGGYNF